MLYVLQSKGSSPGRQGFMMAVNSSGEMSGSLGGGIMEFKFVELAKIRLLESYNENAVHLQVHDKAAPKNQSGMICSGEQTIFLYTVQSSDSLAIEQLISSLLANDNGTLHLSPNGITFEPVTPSVNYFFDLRSATEFFYTEKTGYQNNLYIIGGGHCALALSQLFSALDFYIQLIDDRPALHTIEANRFVHKKQIVTNYADLSDCIEQGSQDYVVVMTVGYRTDAIALKALAGKQFKYIGLLGSTQKTARLLHDLQQEGIDADWLKQVHAPIGLPIKSQTPEEIAISIAAEIIRVKNGAL